MRPPKLSAFLRQPLIATGLTPVPGSIGGSSAMRSCSLFSAGFLGSFRCKRRTVFGRLERYRAEPGMDEASIFLEALNKPSLGERAAFLDKACGGNDELRRSVELLLKAHDKAGDFLAQVPAPVGATTDQPANEAAGTVIGAYKLIEPIGEGGMGTVWMAQQTEPVKRVVALKLIKPGMDSKQVIARFEAERQALALMDHTNIARVLDAGTTDVGRPYFVMDLGRGVPITKYCDEHSPSSVITFC